MDDLVRKINAKYDGEEVDGRVPGENEKRTQFRQILEDKIKEKLNGIEDGTAFIIAHELTLRFFLNLEYESGKQTILDKVEKIILDKTPVQKIEETSIGTEKKVAKPSTGEEKMAFVFLLMNDDKYLPGVIATAYGLRKHGTKHDLVLLYTPDVQISTIKLLRKTKLFDQLKKVLYIEQKISRETTEYYGEWVTKTATKWQALRLTQYKKILFMDIDMLIIDNIDSVFDIEFPAAVFPSQLDERSKRVFKMTNLTKDVVVFNQELGASAKDEDVLKALKIKNGRFFNGGTVGIIPSTEYYKELLDINKEDVVADLKGNNGPDEKLISYLYAQDTDVVWHNLTSIYNFIVNRPDLLLYRDNGLVKWMKPKVLHYSRKTKPWNIQSKPGTPLLASNILWMRYLLESIQKYKIPLEDMKYYLSKSVYDLLNSGFENLEINLDVFDQKYNPWMFESDIEGIVSEYRVAYLFEYSLENVEKIIETAIKIETFGSGIDKVIVVDSLDEDVSQLRKSGLFNMIAPLNQINIKYDKTLIIDPLQEMTKSFDYKFQK